MFGMKNPLLKALAVDRGDAALANAGGQQRVGGGLGILLADHADRGFRHGGGIRDWVWLGLNLALSIFYQCRSIGALAPKTVLDIIKNNRFKDKTRYFIYNQR